MTRRIPVRGLAAACAPLAIVLFIVCASWDAAAQHTAKDVRPAVPGVPEKRITPPTRLAAKNGARPAKMPTIPGTRRVVQDFEQKTLPDGSIVGTPVELDYGVQETVSEIQARQTELDKFGPQEFEFGEASEEPRINELRQYNPQNPESLDVPSWPPSDGASVVQKTEGVLNPQTLGVNFTAATVLGVNPTNATPPDSMGCVGPTQFITAVNGRIVTFAKATGLADGVMNTSEDTFFTSVRNGSGTSDPRIRFDRITNRWFIVIINVSTPNRILIAVSDAASAGVISGSTVWTFYFIPIDTTPPAISATCLCDYETLGVDANALYIGGNNFCGTPQVFNSTDGYVVRKSSVLSGGPIVVTAFRGLVATAGSAGPYTPQGVDNFDPAATEGYFIGVDNATFGTLMVRRVSTPGGTPTISGNISVTVTATSSPVRVPHLGNTGGNNGRLDPLDDRLFAAHIRNGRLWTAHNISVQNTGSTTTGNRNGARWYELQNLTGTPTVVQSGTVFDPSLPNDVTGLNFWIPSVMVSGQGHAAMAFSRAGTNARADAYTCGRLSGDSLGSMQPVTAITASSTAYNPAFDTGATRGSRRWGDYSYTSVDPVDDMTMWTTQEFCDATNSYGVRVVKLIAPPPPTPAVATPSFAAPGQASVNITITGLASEVTAGAGYFDTTPVGIWNPNRITATISGGVTVNSISSVAPGSLVLNISTVGAPSDNTANTVTITNPDGQSRNAAIFNVFAPAAVGLESFTATAAAAPSPGGGGGSDVTIRWTTGYEVGNLGFNLYRIARGQRELLTPKLVAGSALRSNDLQETAGPRVYTFVDHVPKGARNVRYVLEDVDLNGSVTPHGPVRITRRGVGAGQNAAPVATNLVTIDELGRADAAPSDDPPFSPVTIDGEQPAFEKAADTTGPTGAAIKLAVRQQGWYAVTGQDLLTAGLDPATDPRNLQLWADGKPIAALVRGESDGRLDATDTVEFFGTGLNLPSTDTRVYWLAAGTSPGLRIKQTAAPSTPVASPSYPFTVERKDRIVYFSSLLNGDADNFLGAVVSSTPVDQTIAVAHLDTSASRTCTLDVALRGITRIPHAVAVTINGVPAGTVSFANMELGQLRVTLPSGVVHEGVNTVRLAATGAGFDISAVDSIRLTYFHTSLADSDRLRLAATGSSRGTGVTVGGFTTPNVRLVDVTSTAQPSELVGTVSSGAGGYAIAALVPPGAHTLYAFTAEQTLRPASIVADRPSNLRTAQGADLVIVAPRDFLPSLAPLVALRQSEGLSVMTVDLEDVFDEFSYGERVPEALRAFATTASTSWSTRARFLLLVGDGSFDPRDYFHHGPSDIVPARLIDTTYMETASDDWYVDANGDGAPELAIGRLPVRSATEVAALVAKLVAYDTSGTPPSGAVVVSDVGDTYDFHAASQRISGLVPAGTPVTDIRRDVLGDSASHTAILDAINAGPRLLTWNGHGSVTLWRGDVLTNQDAVSLTNSARLPLLSSMTCLNGYFIDPTLPSLTEALLAAPQGGVVGAWSGSGMSLPDDYEALNEELYRQLFAGGPVTLGEAIVRAKQAGLDVQARRTWIFLGDPSSRLR